MDNLDNKKVTCYCLFFRPLTAVKQCLEICALKSNKAQRNPNIHLWILFIHVKKFFKKAALFIHFTSKWKMHVPLLNWNKIYKK